MKKIQIEYVYCPLDNMEGVVVDQKDGPDGRMLLVHWPHSGRVEWRRESSLS